MRLLAFSSAVALLGLAASSPCQEAQGTETPKEKESRWWAVDLGAYFPVDGEIQDRFGNTLLRVGLRPYDTRQGGKGKVVIDGTIITGNSSGSRLLAIPITVGMLFSNGDPEKSMTFFMFGVGPAYYNYSIKRASGTTIVRVKDSTFGWGAHVDVGVTVGKRLTITGRYDWLSQTDDFDFSGWSVNVSYALFRW